MNLAPVTKLNHGGQFEEAAGEWWSFLLVSFFLVLLLVGLGFELGSCTCKAGALPLEPKGLFLTGK
jgi:hypothetical protein